MYNTFLDTTNQELSNGVKQTIIVTMVDAQQRLEVEHVEHNSDRFTQISRPLGDP